MYVEEFDPYAMEEPQGDWNYELDDATGVQYGPSAVWPLAWLDQEGKPTVAAVVRLSPDAAFRSWRQVHLMAFAKGDTYCLRFGWMLRAQGLGGYVARVVVSIDLSGELLEASHFPPAALPVIRDRVRRFLAWLDRARAERDAGRPTPQTAHERWLTHT